MVSCNTSTPRVATIIACDIVAPIVGAALTAPSYLALTPFQIGMNIASAGMVAHAAAKLGHPAVEVYWIDPPSPVPESERTLVAGAERRS